MNASDAFTLNFAKPEQRDKIISSNKCTGSKVYESLLAKKSHRTQNKADAQPKQKKKLSRREIKEKGLYVIPHGTILYKDAVTLHRMWCGYVSTLFHAKQIPDVTSPQYNTTVASLLKADFHGAKIRITRSRQSSVVGMKGIVILDTKGTFKIVSRDNKIRTIPKDDSLFEVHFNDTVISIFGKFLNSRPAERSVRKMKQFSLPDL